MLQEKICMKCSTSKDIKNFNKDKGTRDGYKVECKQCRAYRQWVRTLKKVYNVTPEEYNDMYEEQEGFCDICGAHQDSLSIRLAVDHNHTTGKVRALLCMKCNTDLGVYENREQEFKRYLQRRDN